MTRGSRLTARGAAMRAAACAGLGHLYAGRAGRAWLVLLAVVAAVLCALPAWVYGGAAQAVMVLAVAAALWLWQVFDAARLASSAPPDARPPHLGEALGYYAAAWVLLCASLGAVVRPLVVEGVVVSGSGMLPGLMAGDRVLVAKAGERVDEPRRGDVVVFEDPDDGALAIMRVVGKPGDRIEVRYGRLFVNDRDQDDGSCAEERYDDLLFCRVESSADGAHYRVRRGPYGAMLPMRVPEGRLFVMADNRGDYDDAVWREISAGAVIGYAGVVWWSEARGRRSPVRWSRIGARL